MNFIFYLFAAIMVVSALGILFTGNLLYAGFLLLITLISVSVIFVFTGSDFLAVAQVMIYIGGILVLLLFAIMLEPREKPHKAQSHTFPFTGLLLGSGIFTLLFLWIQSIDFKNIPWITQAVSHDLHIKTSTVETLGIQLLTSYILPFELSGIVLLIVLIGSTFIAGKLKL
jgi:NADH:ubiquinone oxidoreductase subunit 6 (subunit J)